MNLHNEAFLTRKLNPTPYTQDKILNSQNPNRNPYVYPVTDWYDMLFKDVTNNRHLNFSASGGGKIARYYAAASVIRDNGVLNVDKRNNFRVPLYRENEWSGCHLLNCKLHGSMVYRNRITGGGNKPVYAAYMETC
jgi:hypothetical protein